MRYWAFSLIILLLASPAWGQALKFGYDTWSTSQLGVTPSWCYAARLAADHYTASTDDQVYFLSAQMMSPNASGDSFAMAIYDVDGTAPDNKIMESGRIGATSTTSWYGIRVSQTLTNGEVYCVAEGEYSTGTWQIFKLTSTNAVSENGSTFPATWSGSDLSSRFAMFAEYLTTGMEVLFPDGVGSPDQWTNVGTAATKDVSVADGIGTNYIYEDTDEQKQRVTMENPSVVTGDDTIDSVGVIWWGQDNGSGNNRAMMNQFVSADSNSGISIALTTIWTEYADNFALAPDGGAWTLTDLNNLQLGAQCTAIGASREVRVTRLYAMVYFTPAGVAGEVSPRRRKILTGVTG